MIPTTVHRFGQDGYCPIFSNTKRYFLSPIGTLFLLFALQCFNAISLKATDYYWVGGSGNWSDYANHWATSSGGNVFHGQEPSQNDDVFFDQNSGFLNTNDTVRIESVVIKVHNMFWNNISNTPLLYTEFGTVLKIYGSLELDPGMGLSHLLQFQFTSTHAGNHIKTSGKLLDYQVIFDGLNGEWTLSDNLNVEYYIYFFNGTLHTNGKEVKTFGIIGFQGKLDLSSSNIFLFDMTLYDAFDLDAGKSTVYLDYDSRIMARPKHSFFNITANKTNSGAAVYNCNINGKLEFNGYGYYILEVTNQKVFINEIEFNEFAYLFNYNISNIAPKNPLNIKKASINNGSYIIGPYFIEDFTLLPYYYHLWNFAKIEISPTGSFKASGNTNKQNIIYDFYTNSSCLTKNGAPLCLDYISLYGIEAPGNAKIYIGEHGTSDPPSALIPKACPVCSEPKPKIDYNASYIPKIDSVENILVIENLPPGYEAVWFNENLSIELYHSVENSFKYIISENSKYYFAIRNLETGCLSPIVLFVSCPKLPLNYIACVDKVQISIDTLCEATIYPSMILANPIDCTNDLTVFVQEWNDPKKIDVNSFKPGVQIGRDQVGHDLKITVVDNISGNTCWGHLYVEDKLPPVLYCPSDTFSCYAYYHYYEHQDPIVEECSKYTLELVSEHEELLHCDVNYQKIIIKKWQATDQWGNKSPICTQEIYIRRVNLDDISFPENVAYSCSEELPLNEFGNPDPEYTGVPYLYEKALWPNENLYCNLIITYRDALISDIHCTKKIMRLWTVRSWVCDQEIERTVAQLIELIDNEGPIIDHAPYHFTASTNHYSCTAKIIIPKIEAHDACHTLHRIDIEYPGGFFKDTNGGQLIELGIGEHIIQYRLYDECYNLTSYDLHVTVIDDTKPIAICDKNTVVSLNHAGFNWVPAEVFDEGSFDECHLSHFEARRMDTTACDSIKFHDWAREVGFCCSDIGKRIMVAMRAVDAHGNSGSCMVFVDIQDKEAPYISCPPNISIDCRYPIDFKDLSPFGRVVNDENDRRKIHFDSIYWPSLDAHGIDGIAIDNCEPKIDEQVDATGLNSCREGYIYRTFTATDLSGNTATCSQHIYVKNHRPFIYDSIKWPLDLDTSGICDPNRLTPELLNEPYNKPLYDDDICSLVGVTYKDEVFSQAAIGEPCFKIFRHWKIIDWCQKDHYGNNIIWTHTQVIKSSNKTDPKFTRLCRDTTICSYEPNCQSIPITLSIDASDDCTNKAELFYTFKIDYDSDGTFDYIRQGVNLTKIVDSFPLGNHLVKWEVEDRCGNTALCISKLYLKNCKPPIAYCLRDVAVSLVAMDLDSNGVPDTKMIQVWASDINANSKHDCGYAINLSFSQDLDDKFRTYNCDSIGSRNVELWVTDENGNTSVCKTHIIIQDNPNNAPKCPNSLNPIDVKGLITTDQNIGVQHVDVNLEQSKLPASNTNEKGEYAFNQMLAGGSYVINPYKNDDWLNGVTTADIVKIQKHILGVELINSPYLMIAADVNHNKVITAADIAALRKLILGITTEIPSNTSWRFVDEQYNFQNVENALQENFPESYNIPILNNNMSINFKGIKIGDLNGSVKANGLTNTQTRSKIKMQLNTDAVQLNEQQIYACKFTSSNVEDFAGFQFTLQFNTELLELLDIEGNKSINLNENNFSLLHLQDGKITCSWNGKAQNEQELFVIKIKAKAKIQLKDVLFICSSITPSLSVTSENKEAGLELVYLGNLWNEEFQVFENEPNPWKDQTNLNFIIPETGNVVLKIFDAAGKQIYLDEKLFVKGFNEWGIQNNQISQSGVLYYQLIYANKTISKKMVLIN